MAISINWGTKVIYVPQADLTHVSGTLYSLDVDAFRLALKGLEDSEDGMAFEDTHRHTTETVLSGVTYARFVEIINGYTVDFEDGQYVVQLFGANNNLADVKVANQVSLVVQNSAGLVNVVQLYQSAYLGSIWVDTASGSPGTSTVQGNGTPGKPVDNMADAMALSAATGLKRIVLLNGAVSATANIDDFYLELRSSTSFDLNGQSCDGLTVDGGLLVGAGSGSIKTSAGALANVSGVEITAERCALAGTIALGVGASSFLFCFPAPGAPPPVIDFVGAGRSADMLSYSGGLEVRNMTDASNAAVVEFLTGDLTIASTCTAGTLLYRGDVVTLTDSSAGTTVTAANNAKLFWDTLMAAHNISGSAGAIMLLQDKFLRNRIEESPGNPGTMVLYDDDGTTPLLTWQLRDYQGGAVVGSTGSPARRAAAT